jgi:hypothetical protein
MKITRMVRMNEEQREFLIDEFFNLTLRGTGQRARVYREGAAEPEKHEFRKSLRKELERMASAYKSRVPDEQHERNIDELAETLSTRHERVLAKGRFRIGCAQKALNLYLKYLWCFGEIGTPPQCPFDFGIIGQLPGCEDVKWTELDDHSEYHLLVEAARRKAGAQTSLADWELHNL